MTSARVLRVGLTGGIGSGKSAVASVLEKLGAPIVDTDAISHEITAPGGQALTEITKQFGKDYLNADGSLNRKKMRELVFSDSQAKAKLEHITHPWIRKITEERTREAILKQPPYVVLMVPLLIESGQWLNQNPSKIDCVVVVDCPVEEQIHRVTRRDGTKEELIQKIIATQSSPSQRLAVADYVVKNNGDLVALIEQSQALHQQLLARAKDFK